MMYLAEVAGRRAIHAELEECLTALSGERSEWLLKLWEVAFVSPLVPHGGSCGWHWRDAVCLLKLDALLLQRDARVVQLQHGVERSSRRRGVMTVADVA